MLYTHGEGSFSTRLPQQSHVNPKATSRSEHLDISYITSRLNWALDLSYGHQIIPQHGHKEGAVPATIWASYAPSPRSDQVQPMSESTVNGLPIWYHESNINFNNKGDGDAPDIVAQEQALLSALDRQRRHTQDSLLIANGTLCSRTTLHKGQVGVYTTAPILNKKGVTDWTQMHHIVSQPFFSGVADDDEYVLSELGFPTSVYDLFQAASVCRDCGRIDISSDVYIHALDADKFDPNEGQLPFRLRVLIRISLLTPNIFEPVEELHATAAESQRRLLTFVLRHVLPTRMPKCYPGETNIPFFFSCLKPAPASPSDIQGSLLQPKGLELTLLPFQRNSVFWMLNREGMTIGENGAVSSKDARDDPRHHPLFWESVNPAREGISTPSWYVMYNSSDCLTQDI